MRGDSVREEGVSNIIGVILVLGILSVFLITVRVGWVPEWEEEKEARMTEVVENQFAQVVLGLQRDQDSPVVYPLDLSRPTSYWVPVQLPATLAFEAGTSTASASMNLQQISYNGAFQLAEEPNWSALASATAESILWLQANIPSPATGSGNLTIAFSDNSGALGSVEVGKNSGLEIRLQSQGSVIDSAFVNFGASSPSAYQLDILKEVDTESILGNPDGDIQISITNTMSATFAWALETNGIITSESGEEISWSPSANSGSLRVDLNHQYMPAQELVLEQGAIVLEQPNGQSMRVPAGMAIANGHLQLTTTVLTGDPQTAGDTRSLGVQINHVETTHVTGRTDTISYTLTTNYPEAWALYWTEQFEAANIPTSQYSVTQAAGQASFTYDGASSGSDHDIFLEWTQYEHIIELVI